MGAVRYLADLRAPIPGSADRKRRDGVIALGYYVYLLGLYYGFGQVLFHTNYSKWLYGYIPNEGALQLVANIPVFVLQVAPLLLILRLQGEPLRSVGITRERLLRSCLLGILASLLLLGYRVYQWGMDGLWSGPASFYMLFEVVYLLVFISFVEELVFRGYLQSRITGLFRSRPVSIIAGGLLFAGIHIPFQMVNRGLPLLAFIQEDAIHLAFTFAFHLLFLYLYTRERNLAAPVILHTVMNMG